MKKVLFIDNFDSFTYNLVQYVEMNGAIAEIVRNNITVDECNKKFDLNSFDALIISPGPCTPKESGCSKEYLKYFLGKIPILGVCLGMQIINEYFGGKTILAPIPLHGKQSVVKKNAPCTLLQGIPNSFKVARYHSLICNIKKDNGLILTSVTDDDLALPMSISSDSKMLYGVQFHPESFLCENGFKIMQNFVEML